MAQILINFCPTGVVPTTRHNPHVPVSVQRIVEEVHEAAGLGITIAHLHARDENEAPTPRKEIHAEIVEGIRRHCPGLVLCLSTSGRNTPDFQARSAVIELRPDLCSLTLGSLNFIDQASVNAPDMIVALAEKMKQHGVRPEFECFHMGMINYGRYLIRKVSLEPPYYWNLLYGNIAGMQADPGLIGMCLREIESIGPVEQHWTALAGLGKAQLKVNAMAIAIGCGVRVGLEDNLWFDEGKTVPATNLGLLRRVHQLIQIQGHEVMPSSTFGRKGFYNAAVHPR